MTPALALRYLRELSTDVRAAAVLDRAGRTLAGEAGVDAPARELVAVLDALGGADGRELHVRLERGGRHAGAALVARATDGPALALAVGPHALLELLRHDALQVVGDLVGEASAPGADDAVGGGVDPVAGRLGAGDPVVVVLASGEVRGVDRADSHARRAISAGTHLLGG